MWFCEASQGQSVELWLFQREVAEVTIFPTRGHARWWTWNHVANCPNVWCRPLKFWIFFGSSKGIIWSAFTITGLTIALGIRLIKVSSIPNPISFWKDALNKELWPQNLTLFASFHCFEVLLTWKCSTKYSPTEGILVHFAFMLWSSFLQPWHVTWQNWNWLGKAEKVPKFRTVSSYILKLHFGVWNP